MSFTTQCNPSLYETMDLTDLTPKEVKVRYNGKDYVLREASVNAVCLYRNFILACTKMGPDGKPTEVKDLANAEPLIVSHCLFELKQVQGQPNPAPVPVKLEEIKSWGSRAGKALFDRLKSISDLDMEEAETEEAITEKITRLQKTLEEMRNGRESNSKKPQTATTDTSE